MQYPIFGDSLRISKSGNENAHYHKNEGVDTGEPDLWVYVNYKNVCYVLRLELKKKAGRLLPSQKDWNTWFDAEYGNCQNMQRAVAYGFIQAKEIIEFWLKKIIDNNNL